MTPKKRVRFPETCVYEVVCELPTRAELSEQDMTTLFFTKHDFQLSRSAAKVISREAERYGFAKNLVGTYAEKSKEAQEKLNVWAAYGHARRGLERWANRDHGETRQKDQFQAIMAVLRAQDDFYAKGMDDLDPDKVSDHLRKISHKATRTSRHFARMMGKADSFAVAQELQEEERSISTELSSLTMRSDLSLRSKKSLSATVTTSTTSTTVEEVDDDDTEVDLTPQADELDDSKHISKLGRRLKRFGFGRRRKESVEGGEGVSRVA